ncbi:MAG: hypothetical protein K2O18_00120, partial [Oscillospiraceae bacterium]|nr:hypothetical protein [Oscillospiraceae bacterium]
MQGLKNTGNILLPFASDCDMIVSVDDCPVFFGKIENPGNIIYIKESGWNRMEHLKNAEEMKELLEKKQY